MNPPPYILPEVVELDEAEGRDLLDSVVRDDFGYDLDEFMRRFRCGEFDGSEDPRVSRVVMLFPFAF